VNRALCLVVLVASGAAGAVEIQTGGTPVRLDVTSATIAAWHTDNLNNTRCDDDFGELLERLNLNGSWGDWVAGLRVDGSFYHPRPEITAAGVPGLPCRQVDLAGRYLTTLTLPGTPGGPLPERLWAGYNGRTFEVTVGDSYVSFGRGLSLSLRKTDELGLDNTQRGLRFRVSTDRLSSTVVAGLTNINNVDEASGRYEPDPNDGIVGATADVRVFDAVRVGGSAVTYFWRKPLNTFELDGGAYGERWLVGGPRLEAPRLTPWLGVYLEGVAQRRMHLDGEVETGYGLYGSATTYAGPVTVLLEGKAYGDLAVVQPEVGSVDFRPLQYTALPTLERVQQPLEHAQREVAGGRVRADYNIHSGLGVYANYGLFRDFRGFFHLRRPVLEPATIHDPYVGMDAHFGRNRLHIQGGVRLAVVDGEEVRVDGHVDADLVTGLGGGRSVEVHLVHLDRSKADPTANANWQEGSLQLGYRHRPHWAVSGILDYTTEKGQPQVWYPGASAEWEITPASNLRVFAGTSRGGLRCISGVCRVFPPFAGVKSTLTLRF
jgi:hypothetical protein